MERQPYNNLWADKLLQVSMPDSGESWMRMEAILDRKMPRRFFGDRKRWLLLILLLLLLIGVCNCPGRGRLSRSSTPAAVKPATPVTGSATPANPAVSVSRRVPPGPVPMTATPVPTTAVPRGAAGHADGGLPVRVAPIGIRTTLAAHPGMPIARDSARNRRFSRGGSRIAGHRTVGGQPGYGGTDQTGAKQEKNPAAPPETPSDVATSSKPGVPQTAKAGTPAATLPNALGSTLPNAPGSTKAGPPVASKPAARKDSSQKKKTPPPPPQDQDEKEKDHGWVFGAGLNQFFPTGGQRGSIYNSDGLTGTLSDYLPVPMIRYYLNAHTYIQLEAQLNTPQPTKKNLVISSPLPDTSSSGGILTQVQNSTTIQQLYYFNIPLSIHFSPIENLNIGTGLQFSHLSNAIGEFDSAITTTPVNGTNTGGSFSKTAVTKSFKGDTLFHRIKTNEFRLLLDVNYTYKHFVLGLRYNQALSNFINLQLPTGGTTQARNSSLQLYLRYILWDTRKKKAKTP
jgi:hypothetical protein